MAQRYMGFVLGVLLLLLPENAFAKKDFRGLFGSYKREKFVENEARDTDFGFNISLSTFLPITPIVSNTDSSTTSFVSLPSSMFFNVEGSAFFTLDYNWQFFLTTGWCNYDTRKQNPTPTSPSAVQFYQFEMEFAPFLAGAKYRFSSDDIVPYVGLAGGMSYVRRKTFFDYNAGIADEQYNFAVTAQALAGVEFYIASRIGIHLEMAATYIALPARTYNPSPGSPNYPVVQYQDNPILFRYASGLFVLF